MKPFVRLPPLADCTLMLVTLIAGLGWMFSAMVLQAVPPLLFMGGRFFIAALVLWVVDAMLPTRRTAAVATSLWRPGLLTGSLLGLSMMCWILGLHQTDNMGVGAFISCLGVVLSPVMARCLFGTVLTPVTWWAMLVACTGVACLSIRAHWHVAMADIWFLASALASSVYLNVNGRASARYRTLPLTVMQMMVVSAFCLLGSLITESWPPALAAGIWLSFAASTFVATCLRFFLQTWALGRVPVGHSAFILMLEPVWTALLAWGWKGSVMSPIQQMGGGLVLLSLWISRRSRPRPSVLQSPVPGGKPGQ